MTTTTTHASGSISTALTFKDRVLIVEDDSASFRLIRDIVKDIGFTRVERAAEGSEALRYLRTGIYGLVISDWCMGPMTGLELLESIRADNYLKSLPVVMVTCLGDVEHARMATTAGATDYIVKPFSVRTVQQKIRRLVN